MENVIWAVILWMLVLALIPPERIRQLAVVPFISLVWTYTFHAVFVNLGYYRFNQNFLSIFGVPVFCLFGGAAAGLLLINFWPRIRAYKFLSILAFSSMFLFSERAFINSGVFQYLKWNPLLSFAQYILMFSLLAWICRLLIGADRIYRGRKLRGLII